MKIAIAQMNMTVGDMPGNVDRIVQFAERARAIGARLLVTPELAVCGYPPEDLLLRPDFLAECERALDDLAQRVRGIALVVGHPRAVSEKRYNSASVILDGRIAAVYDKRNLPNYTVFDEARYFESGSEPCVFGVNGVRFGVNICEDTWGEQPPAQRGSRDEVAVGVHSCAESWPAEAPRAARERAARFERLALPHGQTAGAL